MMTIQLCFFADDVEEGDSHNDDAGGGGGENDSDGGDNVVDCNNNGGISDISPLAWSPPTIRSVSSPQTYH